MANKNKKHKDVSKPFKWKLAVGDIILWLVTWNSRYALSYRDLKEIADERGLQLACMGSDPFVLEEREIT